MIENLTMEQKERYYNDIPVGIENMVSRQELARRWRLSDRSVRNVIALLRDWDNGDDYIIYSSSYNMSQGYCKTNKPALIRSFICETRERAGNTFKAIRKATRIERDQHIKDHQPNNKLVFFREKMHMTQEDVTKQIRSLDRQMLSRYERGHALPTKTQLHDLCLLYGCTATDIYGAEYPAEPESLCATSAQLD